MAKRLPRNSKASNDPIKKTTAAGIALITGASRGIGLELAKLFAADGHPLILVAHKKEPLMKMSQELTKQYAVKVNYIACDLSQPDAAQNLFNQIQHEPIQHLVNNAGIGHQGELIQVDPTAIQNLLQLNIVTLTLLTRLCLPILTKHPNARILQVASTAAFQPGPYFATYYASKAYVVSFSRALAYELRNSRIKVTCLCPGPTATEFHARANLINTRLFHSHMMSAAAVAKTGYQAMQKGKVLVIPGFRNKLLMKLSQLAPTCLTIRAAGYINQKRAKL